MSGIPKESSHIQSVFFIELGRHSEKLIFRCKWRLNRASDIPTSTLGLKMIAYSYVCTQYSNAVHLETLEPHLFAKNMGHVQCQSA